MLRIKLNEENEGYTLNVVIDNNSSQSYSQYFDNLLNIEDWLYNLLGEEYSSYIEEIGIYIEDMYNENKKLIQVKLFNEFLKDLLEKDSDYE